MNDSKNVPYENSEAKRGSPILRFFEYEHLPAGVLQDTSKFFHTLAHVIEAHLPTGAEKAVALRKLLESKDAAVRAMLP